MNSLIPKSSKLLCDAPAKGGGWCKYRARWGHTGPFHLCGHHERKFQNREFIKLGDGALAVQRRDGSTYIEGRRYFDRKGRPFIYPDDRKD